MSDLESDRLRVLRETGLLDGPREESFDRVTRLAARLLCVPITMVSLIDAERHFAKSTHGIPESASRDIPLSHSICRQAVETREALVIQNTSTDPRTKGHAVARLDGIASYAGIPLITSDHHALGALCAVDSVPRIWTEAEIQLLRDLSSFVVTEIELRRAATSLAERERVLKSILDHMEEAVIVADSAGQLVLSNPASRGLVAGDRKHLAPDGPTMRAARGEEQRRDEVFVTQNAGDEGRWYSLNTSPLRSEDGRVTGAITVGRDITGEKATRDALVTQQALYRTMIEHMPRGAVFLFDHDLRYVAADGPRVFEAVGIEREKAVGSLMRDVALPENFRRMEPLCRSALSGVSHDLEVGRSGRVFAVHVSPVRDATGAVAHGMIFAYDVTERNAEANELREARASLEMLAEDLRAAATHDQLTGLLNRRGFISMAAHALKVAARTAHSMALFFVDLNGMKDVNDRHGHEAGDLALRDTTAVLRATFRESDLIARMGGDEFVVLATAAAGVSLPLLLARMQENVGAHNATGLRAFQLSMSVGSALFDPAHPKTIEALLAEADAGMYVEKKATGAHPRFR
jgi:diguanylate cyclase (GGDEF)-like protein/PAS domain S-box-containing protein